MNEAPSIAPQTPIPPQTFVERNEFLLRRLHSLSGVVPLGVYTIVHLLTNASILESWATFQRSVYAIHSLGMILPIVEWVFIFIPLIFHAVYGIFITRSSLPNHSNYRYGANFRYTLQRATGIIAFLFIFWHVFHMHGWFHADMWMQRIAEPLGGGKFRAYNAASTAFEAMQMSPIVPILYAVGVLSVVYHLANGIWTFGITWGLWTEPPAQRRASWACLGFGLVLGTVGMSAVAGFTFQERGEENIAKIRALEDHMYEERVRIHDVEPNEHKRKRPAERPEDAPVHADASSAHN